MKFHEAIQKAYPNLLVVNVETPKLLIEKGLIPMIMKEFRGVSFIYPKGIYFDCMSCGNCCKQDVPLSKKEVDSKLYETKNGGDCLSFTNKFLKGCKGDDCIYLKNKKCEIYEKRPVKCKTYPWSPDNYYQNKIAVQLYIELLKDFECNGFHIGKMKFEHLKPFISAIKEEFRVMKSITADDVLENVSKKEFAKNLRKQAEIETPWIDISKLSDDDLIKIAKGEGKK